MSFAIASKELTQILRRRASFIAAGVYYAALSVGASGTWFVMQWSPWEREIQGRAIFNAFVALGYTFLSLHAALVASHSLVGEREAKTASLLRTAPVRPFVLVLQKLAAPMAMEWLFLVGSLPFLGLVFLLGGVSGGEFVYQLINLAVWLNTSILIGLWVSSWERTSTRADRNAAGFLIVFGVFTYLLPSLLTRLLTLASTYGLSGGWMIPTRPIEAIRQFSPIWMVSSWHEGGGSLGMAGFDWFQSCPALASWLEHIALQMLLLWAAVGGWKRTTEEAEDRSGARRRVLFWKRSVKRAEHGFFPEGWRAFYELEDREVFKQGWRTKRALLIVCGLLFLVLILGGAPPQVGGTFSLVRMALFGSSSIIHGLLGGAVVLIAFGLASNAFRRERETGTAVLLLDSPVPAWEAFKGKWYYYQVLCFKVAALGIAGSVSSVLGSGFSSSGDLVVSLLSYPAIAVSIPLMCLIGVLSGLYKRPARYGILLVAGFMCCGGGYCLGIIGVPIILIFALGVLHTGPRFNELFVESNRMGTLRVTAFNIILIVLFIDVASIFLVLGPYAFEILPSLLGFNLLLLPPCLAVAGWVWVAGRTEGWWRKRLIG
jgi:hypothetical protein